MSEKIKFGVVGCGHIGKRHAEMIVRNDESELVALCDIADKDGLGLESFDAPFYSSIDEMLNAGIEMDVVCICTPNGLHADQASQAIDAGMHVVVVEADGAE